MVAFRSTPTPENFGASIGEKTYARKVSTELEALWRWSAIPLISVSGTNTVLASVDTAIVTSLTAYASGQKFSIIPAITNSGGVTVNINSVGAAGLKDADGAALVSGAFVAGRMYIIQYDGTNFRVVMPGASFTAASQAQQETGSSLVVGVAPGVQQYHASANKAWLRFNGTGTPAINASYNCSSITDRGTGKWTINFTTAFSGVNYGAAAFSQKSDATDDGNMGLAAGTTSIIPTASTFPLTNCTGTTASLIDTSAIYAMFAGDQ